MATNNNNDARQKQKRIEAADPVVVVLTLCFGNILREFPDFLFCLLPCIADRVIWNAIASSNKDMHEKSMTILPPWPLYYKLPQNNRGRWSVPCSPILSWSPCGTRIACLYNYANIVIFDERFGPLRNTGLINTYSYGRHHVTNLEYSPNGRFLVLTGNDGFVRLWDTVTGNYEQLQEWNMREEAVNELNSNVVSVSVSACSNYIAVSSGTSVFLKNVEGKTITSFISPNENRMYIDNIMFSSNDRAVLISCRDQNSDKAIKVWRPYLDGDDEDRLITLWRQKLNCFGKFCTFSHDTTMVTIYDTIKNKGTLWSIDMDNKCLLHKSDIQVAESQEQFSFTPDDKYVVCNTTNGPEFWSINEQKISDNTTLVLNYGNTTKHNRTVFNISPNNRQLVIKDSSSCNYYITSYSVN